MQIFLNLLVCFLFSLILFNIAQDHDSANRKLLEYQLRYDNKSSFSPDPTFKNQIMDLRQLDIYYEAWTHEPGGLFEKVPEIYNKFYEGQIDNNNAALKKLREEIRANRKTENEVKEILTILIRYAYCLKKKETYRNCPNPCNNAPCKDLRHTNAKSNNSLKHDQNCRVILDLNAEISPALKNNFPRLASIFKKSAVCLCPISQIWDKGKKYCVDANDICHRKYDPCNGYGTCYTRSASVIHPGGFECVCLPAFKGPTCQLPRNPCDESDLCSGFKCRRRPDLLIGYSCDCGTNFVYVAEKSVCIDRNECLENICKNNGTCINLHGDYECKCLEGFVGKECNFDMNYIFNLAEWRQWSSWSECSQTCNQDDAIQVRTRTCEKNRDCGLDKAYEHVRKCENKLPDCIPLIDQDKISYHRPALFLNLNTTSTTTLSWIEISYSHVTNQSIKLLASLFQISILIYFISKYFY